MQGSRDHLNGCHDAVEFKMYVHTSDTMKLAAMQEQLMTLDSLQKEKLLSNKAHSLGLSSRSWAKTAKAKKMFGSNTTHRRDGSGDTTLHCELNPEQRQTNYRCSLNSRPHTSMAENQTRIMPGYRSDQSTVETTSHHHKQTAPAMDVERDRENSRMITRGDPTHHQKGPAKPNRNRRRKEDWKKLEQLSGVYDLSRNNRNAISRCPTRRGSRCTNARLSRPATRATTSRQDNETKRDQNKVRHSHPVTQQRRSRGREFVRGVMDLQLEQQHLDESCCWNEIPRKTDAHSKTNHSGQIQTAKPLDFDLDNIMLRAKHRSQSGVAMVTVRLRNHKQTRKSADDAIAPGGFSQEIAEHTARVSRRFSGMLKVQKPLAPT